MAYLAVHVLWGLLLGWGRDDHRPVVLLLGAFFFSNVMACLTSVRNRPK